MEKFKLHPSQAIKIMGRIGLTEIQEQKLFDLQNKPKARTDLQEQEMQKLIFKKDNPELPQTAKSYLHEWYAGDKEELFSVYVQKGNWCEADCIDFMAEMLGFGLAEKNQSPPMEDDYFIGTPDVILNDCIVDVKSSWNIKTLQEQAQGIDPGYELQGQLYMHLYKKNEFILFFGLMDTPEDVNYGKEVIYSTLPDNERWIAYKVTYDAALIEQIQARVLMCRIYLEEYDKFIKSKMGQIQII